MTTSFLLGVIIVAAAAAILFYYWQKKERVRAAPSITYTQALKAVLDGDAARAVQKLRDTVSADTQNVDAYIRLGRLYAVGGDVSKAIKVHKPLTFRADMTQSQRVEVYRALAQDYEQAEDSARMQEAVEQILSLAKKDLWALKKKCDLHAAAGAWEDAFDAAQKLRIAGGDVTDKTLAILKVQEGLALEQAGHGRDGRIRYREALKYDSSLPAPYLYWGDSYVREDRIEDAVKIWRRLIDANPAKSYLVFGRLEHHLFDLGRFVEIEQIYRSLIRSQPENIHASAALVRFLEKRGDIGDAITVLQEGLRHKPDSLWLHRLLIQLHTNTGQVQEALREVREVLPMVMKEGYEFTCSHCGHVLKEPSWLCPECKKLGTYNV